MFYLCYIQLLGYAVFGVAMVAQFTNKTVVPTTIKQDWFKKCAIDGFGVSNHGKPVYVFDVESMVICQVYCAHIKNCTLASLDKELLTCRLYTRDSGKPTWTRQEQGNVSFSSRHCVEHQKRVTLFEKDRMFQGPEFYIKSATRCVQKVWSNTTQVEWGSCTEKSYWLQEGVE